MPCLSWLPASVSLASSSAMGGGVSSQPAVCTQILVSGSAPGLEPKPRLAASFLWGYHGSPSSRPSSQTLQGHRFPRQEGLLPENRAGRPCSACLQLEGARRPRAGQGDRRATSTCCHTWLAGIVMPLPLPLEYTGPGDLGSRTVIRWQSRPLDRHCEESHLPVKNTGCVLISKRDINDCVSASGV